MANLVAGLIAYAFLPKKPAITYDTNFSNQLLMFWLFELRLLGINCFF